MLPSETAVEGGCEGRRKKVVDYRGVKKRRGGGLVWLLATDLKTIASRRRGNFKHTSIDGPDGFCSSKSPEGGWNRVKIEDSTHSVHDRRALRQFTRGFTVSSDASLS